MSTRSRFVVRATTPTGYRDRTFYIDVDGADDPVWNTDAGYLPVGVFGESYALNNQYIDFQLSASPVEAPARTELKYFIANNDGKLPPGLVLEESGRIHGFLRDRLVYDGFISGSGGYDTESYDGYTYDHSGKYQGNAPDQRTTGLPKLYQFRITVSDGVRSIKRTFKILVSSVDIIQYNSTSMPVDIVLPATTSSIQPLQWLSGSDLGTIRANNNQDLRVEVYDPAPLVGTVTYTLLEGNDIFSKLPENLQLDPDKGHIYGYTPYQPAYTRNYSFGVQAVKTNKLTGEKFTATNTFTLALKGEIESYIEWVSDSNLGTLDAGQISELSIQAKQLQGNYEIKYSLKEGNLPNGISLERDGSLAGTAEYGSTGTYTFTVIASDVYELGVIERDFTLTVVPFNDKEYTSIFVRPFLSLSKRSTFRDFISNEFTFDPKLMYRYFDPNFGVQPDIKMYLHFGIEKLALNEYVNALWENFYRRRFYFGDVKVAKARDSSGNVIYEVVYLDIVDDMVNNEGKSASRIVYYNNDIFYPGSVDNMRSQLALTVLPDDTYVDVNEFSMPKFMRTAQDGYYQPPGYMRVVPLCYTLPGEGARIKSRIKLSGFDFKTLDFEIDRIIVESSLDNTSAKYLIFERQAFGFRITSDYYLFGTDEIQLTGDDNQPLIRY